MNKEIKKELTRLAEMVGQEQELSYSELAFLSEHKKEIIEFGDIWLAEWAGVTEREFNEKKLCEKGRALFDGLCDLESKFWDRKDYDEDDITLYSNGLEYIKDNYDDFIMWAERKAENE